MKKYKKILSLSFIITILTLVFLMLSLYMLVDMSKRTVIDNSLKPKEPDKVENDFPDDYVNYSDNVGGVCFTEDQVTELVRNIYSSDGFINNLHVDFKNDGTLTVVGKIKSVEKLCELYPELESYSFLLNMIENKDITIEGMIFDNNGMADYEIKSAMVGDMKLDKSVLLPFLEEGTFAELFNVEYESVEILSDAVVFKNGVPEILSY